MIPLKLELTNFLSYRQTAVLPFTDLHLACIAGGNGAGKSSILDAITWVLFGKSRSKSDDDLVNRLAAFQGEDAEVRLTFALEDVCYRVTRRKRPRKNTTLELQIQTDDVQWKTLTQSKIRETQHEIENLLRMKYDTFVNASFLLQGKADEFTTKTANKRKEILADLLGLTIWDRYKEASSERRKASEGQLALLDAQIQEIEAELAEQDARAEALAQAKASHEQVNQRLQDKQLLLDQLRRTEAAIEQQQKSVQNLKTNVAQAEKTAVDLAAKVAQREAEKEQFTALLADADMIEADFEAWQAADSEGQAWQEKANHFNRLQQEKQPFALIIAQEKSRLEQRQQTLRQRQTAVDKATTEKEGITARQTQLQETLASLTAQLADLKNQEETWHELRAQVQQLEGEQKLKAREQQQWQQKAAQMEQLQQEKNDVRRNLAEAEAALATAEANLAALKEASHQQTTYQAEMASLESSQPALREEFKQKRERIQQLSSQQEGSCPLCGQPLTTTHRQRVLAELEVEKQTLADRGKANNERVAFLGLEIESLAKKLSQLPRQEKQIQTQQSRKATAAARLPEIDKALAEWEREGAPQLAALETALKESDQLPALKEQMAALYTAVQTKPELDKERQETEKQLANQAARLAEIERMLTTWVEREEAEFKTVADRLAQGDYDQAAQTSLANVEAEMEAVGYDAAAHEAAQAAKTALAAAPERHQQLLEARAALKPLADTIADIQKQREVQADVVQTLNQQLATAAAELATLTADGADLQRIEDEVFALREEEIHANRQVGAAQNRLDVLADQDRRRQEMTTTRSTKSEDIRRLKALEKAFGREGVQALLIEQAIPEIEERANELLERLTAGEMRISFETQRQLKSRDAVAETLDIHIQDSVGKRPYSNFSGGEQFRVNFAIRLALSQLLANRSGARLQTLVIDEGFGSQDAHGRQRLIEAINIIQDEFKLILIITHIDELRDAFPSRIQVDKRPSGSAISVVA